MATPTIQTSFTGGELSGTTFGRVDLDKFQTGAAKLRNFFVDYRGGVSNRAGTVYIAHEPEETGRLLPFIFSTEDSYVVWLANDEARIYQNLALVQTIASPYADADLFRLKYVQSADVLTITATGYYPRDLIRASDGTFSFSEPLIGPPFEAPMDLIATASVPGAYLYGYVITALTDDNEETLPWIPYTVESAILDPTIVVPATIALDWGAVAGAYKYNVYKWGPIPDGDPIPTQFGFIGQTISTEFTDTNIAQDYAQSPPLFYDPFRPGQIVKIDVDDPGTGTYTYGTHPALDITGTGVAASAYGIVGIDGGLTSVVILANGINWDDTAVATCPPGTATFTLTIDLNNYYPAAVSYFQQRRVYGGAEVSPQTLDLTQVGLYYNFDRSSAVLDSDAITIAIASREVNQIKSLVPMSTGLVTFTTGMAFLINGVDNSGLTPTNISANPQASTGAGELQPIVVNYNILFVQAQGSIVRDMTFSFGNQSYYGDDRSIWANHLFHNFVLTDWAWSEEPHKLLWCIRDDGTALTMTYVPELNIYGWAHHDTNGLWYSVACVPENNTDAIYFLAKRFNREAEAWMMYFERLDSRLFDCPGDTWFLDCANSLTQTQGVGELILSSGQAGVVTFTAEIPEGSGEVPTYIMEAETSYTEEVMLQIIAETFDKTIFQCPYNVGQNFYVAEREIVGIYNNSREETDFGNVENPTGFTLYCYDDRDTPAAGYTVGPADTFNTEEYRSMFIQTKQIDTLLVTEYDSWTAASTIPATVAGDGSWRRMVNCQVGDADPNIVDQWSGSIAFHAFGNGDYLCCVYFLFRSDEYAQVIEPFVDEEFGHHEPVGVTEDWWYVEMDYWATHLNLIPRELTAEEITQDIRLAYAAFDYPIVPIIFGNYWWRKAWHTNGSHYYFGRERAGEAKFELWRFDEPDSAPYGGPVVGGGFTRLTPWTLADGPNTDVADYDQALSSVNSNMVSCYFLAATTQLVLLSRFYPAQMAPPGAAGDFRMDCTYFNIADDAYDYHQAFVRGWMNAAWAPVTLIADAAYQIIEVQETNIYLDNTSFPFIGTDRTRRWFFFECYKVNAGVVDLADRMRVLVKYHFVYGAAPVIDGVVIPEDGWDTAYEDFGDLPEVNADRVVQKCLGTEPNLQDIVGPYNSALYDTVENKFWWLTEQYYNCFLNPPVFENIFYWADVGPPFLTLSFGTELDVGTIIHIGCVNLEVTGSLGGGSYTGELFEDLEAKYIVPNDPFNTPKPITGWSFVTPAASIDMSHLIGFTVGLVLDGVVQAQQVVPPDGIIEWVEPASRVVCGLPYQSQFESLYLDAGFSPTVQGRRKNIPAITWRLSKTLGPVFGSSFTTMYPSKEWPLVVGTFKALYTGDDRVNVQSLWYKGGQLYLTQNHPMPVTILATVPEVVIGDDGQ